LKIFTIINQPFSHVPADAKSAVIATVSAIDEMTLTGFDHLRAKSKQT
jgi:hypothetical protein